LNKFTLSAGWSRPTRANIRGVVLEEPISVDMQGSTIEELLGGKPWPVNIDIEGAGAILTIDGNIAVGDSKLVDLRLEFDAPQIGALHRLIDVDSGSNLPLSANSVFRWSNEKVSIDDINISVGQSKLSGRVESIVEGQEMTLITKLRSERLDIVELKGMLQSVNDAASSSSQPDQTDEDGDQIMSLFAKGLPSIELDIRVDQMNGRQLEVHDIEIHGRAHDQIIDAATVKMRIDDFLFEGEFDLDVRKLPGKFRYKSTVANLDVGKFLEKFDIDNDADITAQWVEVEYASSGNSLQEITTNGEVRVEVQNMNWQQDESGLDLHIAQFEVNAGPDRATVLDIEGTLDSIPILVRGEIPSLGDILYGNKTTQLSLAANSGNIVGMLRGRVDWSIPDQFTGELVLSGQRMDPEIIDLSLLESPLRGVTISADLAISEREMSATRLSAKTGTSIVTGYARVLETDQGQEVEVRLQAPHIQTHDLIAVVNALSDDQTESPGENPSDNVEERYIQDVFWEYVDAQKLDRRIDVQIEVDEVFAGDDFMGGAQIGLKADNDNFRLQPFTVTLPSGDIDVEYIEEEADEGYKSRLNMYVERLQYGDLAQLYDPDAPKNMRGLVYLDTALTSTADSIAELRSALKGKIQLLIIPEDIDAGVLDLWAANLVVALLTPEDASRPKKLNCMVAEFSVDDGVAKSKMLMLDSTDIIVRGKGEIDINNRRIDMAAAPQAKREKLFSMSTPIAVTGPWNDMQIGTGGAGFIGTLFRWYMTLIYVPFKWITGERFPEDGLETCFGATDWEFVNEN
jgi:hypothetical protein